MKNLIIFSLLGLFFTACATPQIYIIDRQTVMEAEAGGEWPEAETQMTKVSQKAGPTFFAKTLDKNKNRKLQNVLNGELEQ